MNIARRGTARSAFAWPVRRAAVLITLAGCAIPLASVGGCASDRKEVDADRPPRAVIAPPQWQPRSRPIHEPLSLSATSTRVLGPERTARVKAQAEPRVPSGVAPTLIQGLGEDEVQVKYAVAGASVSEVFRTLVSEHLDRSFVLAPEVESSKGSITMDIDESMTRGEIWDLISGLAMVYGWTIDDRNGVVYVRTATGVATDPAGAVLSQPAGVETEQPAVRVRRMKYIPANEALNAVKELVTKDAKIAAAGRALVIADTVRQTARIGQVLDALDVPAFDGVEVWTYRLGVRRPEDAQQVLEAVATGFGGKDSQELAFVAVEGTDRLMVISRDPSLHSFAQDLVAQIDVEPGTLERQAYLYRIQHNDPEQLVSFLRELYGDRIGDAGQRGGGEGRAGAAQRTSAIRLALDKAERNLGIVATPDEFADLLGVLRTIDRPRQQVYAQIIIAEVSLTNRLQFGVQYFLEALSAEGIGDVELIGTATQVAEPTGTINFLAGSGFAVVDALQTEGEVNLLSTPSISLVDMVPGSVQVGGETPIVKEDVDSGTQTGGTTGIRRNIEYRKTGVILTIDPSINESGEVLLKIKGEVTAVGRETEFGPEFTTRVIDTSAIVPHGRTLLLGGIRSTEQRDTRRYIPILGQIPLAGELFRSTNLSEDRTELLIAISPTIINEPDDTTAAMSDFLTSAHGVRAALFGVANDIPRGSLQGVSAYPDQPAAPLPAGQNATEPGEQPAEGGMPQPLRDMLEGNEPPPEQPS